MTSIDSETPASRTRAWLVACRPATLTVSIAPVLVGSACAAAEGGFAPGRAAAALAGALAIQIGTNLANDVFDHERGADGPARLGPVRAVQAGFLPAAAVKAGMMAAFGLAAAIGVYLTWVAGPLVIAIGLASIAAGVCYTAGPFPLAYHGLGDLAVLVFFGGVAVAGTAFVQMGGISALSLAASIPVGMIATAILVVNNLRDRAGDERAGKRTLAVLFGRSFALGEYRVLLAAAYAVPACLSVFARASAWLLLPLATLPFAFTLARRVANAEGRELNPILGGTARLLAAFATLFAAGIVLGIRS